VLTASKLTDLSVLLMEVVLLLKYLFDRLLRCFRIGGAGSSYLLISGTKGAIQVAFVQRNSIGFNYLCRL